MTQEEKDKYMKLKQQDLDFSEENNPEKEDKKPDEESVT